MAPDLFKMNRFEEDSHEPFPVSEDVSGSVVEWLARDSRGHVALFTAVTDQAGTLRRALGAVKPSPQEIHIVTRDRSRVFRMIPRIGVCYLIRVGKLDKSRQACFSQKVDILRYQHRYLNSYSPDESTILSARAAVLS